MRPLLVTSLTLLTAFAASSQTTTPVIALSGILNAASYLGEIAPGSLATLFGNNLADNTYQGPQVLDSDNHFATSVAGVSVSVNGLNAPLIYISPTQINFQVPWETALSTAVAVQVTRATVQSNVETITIASAASPSMFLNDYTTGVAWVTGTVSEGCPTTQCAVQAGGVYQLWANGLGPKNLPEQDGVGDGATSLNDLSVVGGTASCQLTIGGIAATVDYCGAAPGFIIDQLNFTYPPGIPSGAPVETTLTINGATGRFWLPAPATAAQLATQMFAQMTPAQKMQLIAGALGPLSNPVIAPNGAGGWLRGIPELGIPDLYFGSDSMGVTAQPATALPSSIASAATWDLGLASQWGSVIGKEAHAYGMNASTGGNTNLTSREPRDGRTFETGGEDPILAGKIAAAHVSAVQAQHVIGCVKHYAFNDQETGRTESNAVIDDRGGRESDLLAFEIAVKDAGVQSVMCSYNLLNGTWACENPYLLTQVLKGDWGFTGFVMTDWWAIPAAVPNGTVVAAMAGLDQEEPDNQYFNADTLGAAVQSGQVPQSRVDDMVTRVLHAMYQVGVFNQPAAVASLSSAMVADDEQIAQTVEEQGAVLLKNAGGQLPLNAASIGSIAVIGSHADIGVLSGGGSAQVHPTEGVALTEGYPALPGWSQVIWDPSSPLQAIRAAAPNAAVAYNDGTNATTAASLAASSSVAIVFVSQWTSEGMDMPSLNFTDVIHSTPINQDALVAAVAAANPHTIVVMENGGAQVLPWLGSVSAVLEAWFPGIHGGQAIANILFGSVNPSGKLPITFPASVNDLPRPVIPGSPYATSPFETDYSEGLLVGYKWYDSQDYTPEFPFGFGLSYTTFQFSNVALVNNLTASNPNIQVTFNLTNTGMVTGAEVAQVYLALPASANEPPKRLVGWQKVSLTPGQQQSVTVEVDENDSSHPLSYWDTTSNSWLMASGTYTVYLGNSAAQSSLQVAGTFQTGTITGSASAVSVALSTHDQSDLLAAQPTVNFAASAADADTNTIVVDPTQQYQSIEGFGAAFTDSAAYLLMKVEPSTALAGTLNDLFTRDGDGIGLSFMRIPMGASDIALSVYSFDDMTVGETDPSLTNFSIAHDQAYILPLIQQTKRLNPQMKLMANPWSPPGWMKDPTSMNMNPVSMMGGTLLMTAANETAFANYFVKYIQAYQAAGVPIDYITLQNEPLNITTGYPSMGMSSSTQLTLLQNYVLPALTANNISTKVLVYDHNWDTPTYPESVLGGLTAQQLTQVAGTAWHGYGGAPGAQQLVQNEFPSLGTWETEHSGGTWIADQFTSDFLEITQVLRNSAKSYVKWSLALNENLGPNLTQNVPGLGGCNTCTPIVTVNSQTGAVTKGTEFYTLGQYSKYVLPGAVRVYSSNTPAICSVAFQNPDGSTALVVFNSSSNSQTFNVQWGKQSFPYTLPGAAAATFAWTGTVSGSTPPLAATAQIQGSSFSSESGLETETTGDATGAYDLGYISPGAYAVYKNIDFGTAVSQVNVRTASAGNGGTATFYLDSMTSSPIATVNLPVTGGWQTWTNVTATVSGASGVHDLYVVFGGSTASISNVNWFQFQ